MPPFFSPLLIDGASRLRPEAHLPSGNTRPARPYWPPAHSAARLPVGSIDLELAAGGAGRLALRLRPLPRALAVVRSHAMHLHPKLQWWPGGDQQQVAAALCDMQQAAGAAGACDHGRIIVSGPGDAGERARMGGCSAAGRGARCVMMAGDRCGWVAWLEQHGAWSLPRAADRSSLPGGGGCLVQALFR